MGIGVCVSFVTCQILMSRSECQGMYFWPRSSVFYLIVLNLKLERYTPRSEFQRFNIIHLDKREGSRLGIGSFNFNIHLTMWISKPRALNSDTLDLSSPNEDLG